MQMTLMALQNHQCTKNCIVKQLITFVAILQE